jgi:hypothetical protein
MFWFFECGAHEKMFGSYVFAMHEGEQRQWHLWMEASFENKEGNVEMDSGVVK